MGGWTRGVVRLAVARESVDHAEVLPRHEDRLEQRPSDPARAHRRAHCDGVLLLVMEQRAGALPRMPVHVWCMHHVLTTVPFTAGTQRQQMVGYYAIATAETAWVAALVRLVHVLCARSNAAAPASTTSSRSRIARLRLRGSTMRSMSMLAYSASL